jgi:hypothetical protein
MVPVRQPESGPHPRNRLSVNEAARNLSTILLAKGVPSRRIAAEVRAAPGPFETSEEVSEGGSGENEVAFAPRN